MSVLVAEVDQAGHVEQNFHKVVQHQQDQAQAVQAAKRQADVNSSAKDDEGQLCGGGGGGGEMLLERFTHN